MNFNPRTREGCDQIPLQIKRAPQDFNPRTREGCDHCDQLLLHHQPVDFNPRTREGCDFQGC